MATSAKPTSRANAQSTATASSAPSAHAATTRPAAERAASAASAGDDTDSLTLVTILPATPERVYHAWLDGAQHSAMTGGAATVDPHVGGAHTAWDGYITGT